MSPERIRIHIAYAAVLHLSGLPNDADLDLPRGRTIADVLRRGGVREEQLGYVIPVVNGVRRSLETGFVYTRHDVSDDLLVTADGIENLSAATPVTPDAVEAEVSNAV